MHTNFSTAANAVQNNYLKALKQSIFQVYFYINEKTSEYRFYVQNIRL